ncbi:STAS domain-containing protein [Saccharopolyspora sp. MS10]|uniref:STAS domain-containing protein n=1 Tax=Saccharopolyspora sp. MS10 TaxID=3385973 RepID=UPI00399FBA5C
MTVTTEPDTNPTERPSTVTQDSALRHTIELAGSEAPTPGSSALRLRLNRGTRNVIVVQVSGDLDEVGTVRLRELVLPRLTATATVLVLDLSRTTFVGCAALALLTEVQHRTRMTGRQLRLVGRPRCLRRALLAGGLTDHFALHDDLVGATAASATS